MRLSIIFVFAVLVSSNALAASDQSHWQARLGLASSNYYVSQKDNDEGTDQNDWNNGGQIDLASGFVANNGIGVQLDLRGNMFIDNHGSDNDWTKRYFTAAAHAYTATNSHLIGLFAGAGTVADTGDSNQKHSYWFTGLEGNIKSDNSIIFGELGYLDSADQYREAINDAKFARLGLRYFTNQNIALKVAMSGAMGQQDNGDEADSDAKIGNAEFEAEYALGKGETSVFASYEETDVFFDGGDHRANFHSIVFGFRWRPGSAGLRSAYNGAASLELPSLDRWSAYTGNEVE